MTAVHLTRRHRGVAVVRCDWGLSPLRSHQGTIRLVHTRYKHFESITFGRRTPGWFLVGREEIGCFTKTKGGYRRLPETAQGFPAFTA